MRNFALIVVIASLSCADESEGESVSSSSSEASASEASASEASASEASASEASASEASASEASASEASASSGSDGPDEETGIDPTDAEDSGGMSGCEGGPLPAPIAGCTPVPPASTGDPAQDCVDRINQFRWECQCLPPLARWADAEACTDQQAANDQSSGAPHGNFGACGEYAQNTCPDWPSESDVITGCLQAMWDEGPGEPFEAHGHYINMSSTQYTKVACGFSSAGQGVWANQNFTQ